MKNSSCVVIFLSLVMVVAMSSLPAEAQNRFRPAIQANDNIITEYQITQRTRFLALLRAPGDPRALAREQLINETIQFEAARLSGDMPGEDQIAAGLEEFAARANLTAEEFITALGQEGVDAQTFRDFVTAGIAWRAHVQARFRSEARNIPQEVIDRNLARTGTEGGLRVLISEILLPKTGADTTRASRARAAEIATMRSEEEFSTAARLYSVAASRSRAGQLNWVAIETLPENIQAPIRALSPGQISQPIELDNVIGIFLLRDVERVAVGRPETLSIDYALLRVAAGPSEADRIASRIDTCDDLYGIAKDLPEDMLIRESRPLTALPADIRAQIDFLDVNEATTALVRGSQSTVLMLCGRQQAFESTVDFELVGTRLLNTRLTSIAADYLADLRADTFVADLAN
ncbi:peptidyl-prolyl cis-trans isomerase SurA [Boseongicola aestuarii]|uniref:Parvulin-like PPIase n=2 Tax=Boseongicola aestuarii TaxID=1470561 RepID=A0A238IUG2_9RHOB|nr:peptidyl-prolyl cis-trans isomerase SurA [Boseongicola aestuarii]